MQKEPPKNSYLTKIFFVGMALLMTVIVFLGFWPSYFGLLLSGQEFEGHWFLHFHAAIFLGWMATFITQTILAWNKQINNHMRLGRYGFALGVIVFLTGVIVTLLAGQRFVAEGFMTWSQVPFSRPAIDIVQFAILLSIGFTYRNRPEMHKRFMFLATVALMPAATGRMGYLIGPWGTEILFLFMIGSLMAFDIYKKGNLHRASVIGFLVLLPRILLEIYSKFFG